MEPRPLRPLPPLTISWTNAASQELDLRFELERSPTPEQLESLENLVASFVAVGDYGGFVRETVSPVESSLSLTSKNLSTPKQPGFVLAAQQVDVRAFQLIRNCAWRWAVNAQKVLSITVTDRTPHSQLALPIQLPPATWTTEEAGYPPLSRLLRIRIEHQDPADYQKQRRCVVEFGRQVPDDVFKTIVVPIGAWLSLASQGAYGPPVRPSYEAEVWQENVGPYDEYSVELAFSLFEASEVAWNCLLNCLEHYSQTTEQVVLVTIE